MLHRTSQLNALARSLGCMVVVEPIKAHAAGFAEAPSEPLTVACRNDGLEEAIDNDFEEE